MSAKGAIAAVAMGMSVACVASVASASVIDFTSRSTGTTGSLFGGNVTWTMTSNGFLNNSQAYDGNIAPNVPGLSFETDGYGVGKADDEITTSPMKQEWIDITFSKPVLIDALYFLDLFVSKDLKTWEIGQGSVNGGSPIAIVAQDIVTSNPANRPGGFAQTTFKPISATSIRFTILSSNDQYGFADGALAGIGIAPIPLPAAGALLVAGIGGLGMLRRRKRA